MIEVLQGSFRSFVGEFCRKLYRQVSLHRQVSFEAEAALEMERLNIKQADVAQLAEHILGKDEVTSSILVVGSRNLLAGSAPPAKF
jgi:hypothetical protein